MLPGINLFVANMALSDMMMCLTAAPLTPITSFSGRWFLGRLPCVILPACQVRVQKYFQENRNKMFEITFINHHDVALGLGNLFVLAISLLLINVIKFKNSLSLKSKTIEAPEALNRNKLKSFDGKHWTKETVYELYEL